MREIKQVIDFAEAHRFDLETMKKRVSGELLGSPGDWADFACHLQSDYRCVYSIEEHPMGWCRHLSVSVNSAEKLPNPMAVEMIMHEFGFTGTIHAQKYVWVENNAQTPLGKVVSAVNIVQLYD